MPMLQRQWQDFKLAIMLIRDVCMYLDRTWVGKQQPKGSVKEVFEMGLELFRDTVARNERIRHRLLSTMLGYIQQERWGVTPMHSRPSASASFADTERIDERCR